MTAWPWTIEISSRRHALVDPDLMLRRPARTLCSLSAMIEATSGHHYGVIPGRVTCSLCTDSLSAWRQSRLAVRPYSARRDCYAWYDGRTYRRAALISQRKGSHLDPLWHAVTWHGHRTMGGTRADAIAHLQRWCELLKIDASVLQ